MAAATDSMPLPPGVYGPTTGARPGVPGWDYSRKISNPIDGCGSDCPPLQPARALTNLRTKPSRPISMQAARKPMTFKPPTPLRTFVSARPINVGYVDKPAPKCMGHPCPDSCRIPANTSCLPKCPIGQYVERTLPIRPDRSYEPPSIPFSGLSTYRENYSVRCGPRTKSFKPTSNFEPSKTRMDSLSSYREAYTPKPTIPYRKPAWSKKAEFTPSDGRMEGNSTYRTDYRGCMATRNIAGKPGSNIFHPADAKMEGNTTYRTCFVPYCPREYAYAKQQQTMKEFTPGVSCAPMQGTSTYKSDYWPKCCVKRPSMKPRSKVGFSQAAMADRSTYRNDYNPFHFEKCVGQCIPANYCGQDHPVFSCGNEGGDSGCLGDLNPYDCQDCSMPRCCGVQNRGSCGNQGGCTGGYHVPIYGGGGGDC